MKIIYVIAASALMAGCGAQGDPLRPTANIGLGFGTGGVSQSVEVGAGNSNVNFSVGAGS